MNVLEELERASASGLWWNTPTATVLVNIAQAGPVIPALAAIAEVLRAGEDPEWVVGGASAKAAFAVAHEWLDAGIEPSDVADWLRAGCWDPQAAYRMTVLGLRPRMLLNDVGEPIHWVEAGDVPRMSVALAVADNFLTAEESVRVVMGS